MPFYFTKGEMLMEMSVYSHKANDRFRRDKISILEQLGICISKEKEAEIYNKVSEEEIDAYARMLLKENL